MEIIDAHSNLYYPGEQFDDTLWGTFEAKMAVLREAGVSRALASRNESVQGRSHEELVAWNRRIVQACEASDGLYFPSAIASPDLPEACDVLRQCREEFDMRFVGEMFDDALGHTWGTRGYYKLLECAIALRMVPLIHCGDEVAVEIGKRYPEGRFIIAHLSVERGRSPQDRLHAIRPYPNLHLEISSRHMIVGGLIRRVAAELGVERVLFGSDLSAFDPVLAVMCVRRSGLTDREQARVFAGNFHEIWRWTEGGADA